MLYNGGGNFVELLEDMDTSESEHSSCEVDDDVDWKYSSLDEGDESGWAHAEAKGRRRKTKRKSSKPGRHSVAQSNSNYSDDPETIETIPAVEQDTILQKTLDVICCSCSKWSFCKTAKCECRAGGGNCGISCGCNPNKCSNREVKIKDLGALPQLEVLEGTGNVSTADEIEKSRGLPKSELLEGTGNVSSSDETERSHSLVSRGAMLLNTALSEIPAETKNDTAAKRKPLSDIGNTKVLSLAYLVHPITRKTYVVSIMKCLFSIKMI